MAIDPVRVKLEEAANRADSAASAFYQVLINDRDTPVPVENGTVDSMAKRIYDQVGGAVDTLEQAAVDAAAAVVTANAAVSTATTKATEASASADSANTAKIDAQTARDLAQASATAASTSAGTATTKATEAAASATSAATSAENASTSAGAASSSANSAQDSATSAVTSAGTATAAASVATTAKNNAVAAKDAAVAAKTAAETAANAAQSSATSAAASSSAAENSSTTATTKASEAAASAAAANSAKTAADLAKSEAQTSAQNAAFSAASVKTSEQNALISANAAADSATSAAESAGSATAAASTSTEAKDAAVAAKTAAETAANAAQSSATSAAASSSAAENSSTTATTKASEAAASAAAANAAKVASELAKSEAQTSEQNAAFYASAAQNSANSANTSANTAQDSATESALSASQALQSKNDAVLAADRAESAAGAFSLAGGYYSDTLPTIDKVALENPMCQTSAGYIATAAVTGLPEDSYVYVYPARNASGNGAVHVAETKTGTYKRSFNGSEWSAWVRLANTEDVALKADKSYVDAELEEKVDKVIGKGLSTNDFTDVDVSTLGSAVLSYATYAAASAAAATLPDGQRIWIDRDELHYGRRTRNEVLEGNLIFKGGDGIWSVWDFGAVGDGVADDSEAFRAAAACEGQAVLIPWTPDGYKVEGTFATKCRFVGLGKPSINLTVRGGDHRGFWLNSKSGLENFIIKRYTSGTSVSGEFNNAWVIGEYFSPLGTEYRDIVVRDMELIGFDGGVGRRSMTGIYGNSSDIEISNVSMSGYISYGLMIHWGGEMGEDVNTSPVTKSWHPRRIRINGLRMTSPQPDTGLGCVYISGGHDIDGKNIYTYGISNPITIAPGDVGGLVAQGDSVQRVLNNINFESVSLLAYVGTAVTISGVSGDRAGNQWLAANRSTKPSIRIDGLTVSRPQTQSTDGASGRAIDIRLIKNVKINGVDIYHELDGYTTNATPAVFVQTSSDVEVTGEINVPFASEVVGSRDVVIDVKARSLRTDYPANHHGVRITSQHATATTTVTIAAGATAIPVASVGVDMLPGTEIVLPSSNLVVLTTAAVAQSDTPVSIPVTAIPVSLASGATVTINRDCDGVKVRGRLYGFLQNIYCFNSSGGASRNVDIDVISEMSGQYDVYARNVKGLKIDGTFTDSNQTSASAAGNIRLIDSCSGIDIADSAVFERNASGTTKAAHNVYLFGNSEAASVGGKFYNALTSAINQFDPTGASMRPAIGKCWFAPGLPATITPTAAVAKTTTIGDMQIGQGSAAPTTGVWRRGDFVFNQDPAAGGKQGWTCVTGGTPGTWKPAGSIDA